LSKIQTADNVIGIFTSRAMRERGRYQIQLMKTRSSSGVGSKIDLEFDVDTLRIRDLLEDDDNSYSTQKPSAIMNTLKRNSNVTTDLNPDEPKDPTQGIAIPKVHAQTDSTKLRQFLNNLDDDGE